MNRYVIAAALLLAGASVLAQPGRGGGGGGRGGGPFGNFELRIQPVREGIYMIRSSASGNITVFTSDNGVLLVDSKFANEYDRYMELLRTVTDQPVRFVINTHMHGDHTGGNINLEAIDADIIATENARARLAATQQMGLPSLTFDDHMRLYFGGRMMDLYWLGRGHTDGDLVIHIPDENLVMTGDLFAGGDPYVRLIDYNGGGSLREWSDTVEKILELDFDTVIPGHTDPTDRATLEDYLANTRRMHDLITEMHEAGRSPMEIQAAVTEEFSAMGFVVLPGVQAVVDELD